MSLRKNVAANYFGRGWRALMSLAFVPLYIKYLGVEAYGLIGISGMLQSWLALLDMGMTPTLAREMARFSSGAHDSQSIRDILRSIEIIAVGIAAAIVLGIWAASGWLASHWVNAADLPVEVVANAFTAMGAVVAMRFLEGIYVGSIVGLQRQVLQNAVTSVMDTLRGLGAVGILLWVSTTLNAFFVWQGLVSLANVVLLATAVYRTLPPAPRSARFCSSALTSIWRFAAGMMAITFLSLLLTQTDKILLSRLLTLEHFAFYALACTVANTLWMLTEPITGAFYPRFTELVTRGAETTLRILYHQGAQLVSVLTGAAAVVLIAFPDRVLLWWTANPTLVQQVAPLLSVLATGTLLNALMWIPFRLQLAQGWTTLTIKVSIVSVIILVPALLLVASEYGAIGAAWVWVTSNAGYLVFDIYFMHQRLLPTEKWRWCCQDVMAPLAAATVAGISLRLVIPEASGTFTGFISLLLTSGCVLVAAAVGAPLVRYRVIQHVSRTIRKLFRLVTI